MKLCKAVCWASGHFPPVQVGGHYWPGSIPAPLSVHSNCLGPNYGKDGQLAA
jgi:hypothetical protein